MTTKHILLLASLMGAFSSSQGASFAVKDRGGLHVINPAYVDRELRDLPQERVNEVLPHYALHLVVMDNGEYALHGHVRGDGGGILAASIAGATVITGGLVWFAAEAYLEGPMVILSAPRIYASTVAMAEVAIEVALLLPTP